MNDRFRRGTEGPEAGARSATATTTTDDTRVAAPEHTERTDHVDHVAHTDHETERTERRFARDEHTPRHATDAGIAAGTMREVRARQREEFGGINWGSSFFGWLSAMGLAAILAALVSAAGATLSLTTGAENDAEGAAETIGIAGGILLLILLGAAYFAGGYVAGRMSRFDGARQGLGVWIIALVVTVTLAVAAALLGGEYNVLERLNLPNIPVDSGDLATGGLIALGLALVVTLLASMAGGKAGERYHRKVDRVALRDAS